MKNLEYYHCSCCAVSNICYRAAEASQLKEVEGGTMTEVVEVAPVMGRFSNT